MIQLFLTDSLHKTFIFMMGYRPNTVSYRSNSVSFNLGPIYLIQSSIVLNYWENLFNHDQTNNCSGQV